MEEITNKKVIPAGILVGIIIIGGIVFGAGTYLYATNKATQEKDILNAQIAKLQNEVLSAKTAATIATTDTDNKTATTKASSIPSDWKIYKNQKLGYQLKYPGDWTATNEGKSDPAYPFDIEISKEYADAEKGYEYNMGVTSSLYSADATGTVPTKESVLKDIAANSDFKKIAIAGEGEAYYMSEEILGGDTGWIVSIVGDKGMVSINFSFDSPAKEALYRQVIGTFQFN